MMSEQEDSLEQTCRNLLVIDQKKQVKIDPSLIAKRVDSAAKFLNETFGMLFVDSQLKHIKHKLMAQFSMDLSEGAVLIYSKDVQRGWLDSLTDPNRLGFEYYKAYVEYLGLIGRPQKVITENTKIINNILDLSGDPQKTGQWSRRGLVMGNVQSGKTQNYVGLVNKAADLGYQTIIILGGHQNELRNQTQMRIHEGFHGIDYDGNRIGVGTIRDIKYGTHEGTRDIDFNLRTANTVGLDLTGLSFPCVFVVKKNVSILKTLCNWITNKHSLDPENNKRLSEPLLFIDDESDYATPNSKQKAGAITATNEIIRDILNLFERNSYVGYSATPFANIFIDPDNDDDMIGENLFPKDFLIKTPVPKNYCGQNFFFLGNDEEEDQSSPIQILSGQDILDHESKLIVISGQKKYMADEVNDVPDKLKEAIRAFFVSTAVRFSRGHSKEHHTMIVNVSFLSGVNNKADEYMDYYVEELKTAINATSGRSAEEARELGIIEQIYDTFERVYEVDESWEKIFPEFEKVARKIKLFVAGMGQRRGRPQLDYNVYKDTGLVCIVTGGHKLSRGMTFEGLSVTYYARNSKMCDTLMQMCRWFGYRDFYRDLCKVYMPEESFSYYDHISNAINELYLDLEEMAAQHKTPENFGLKVRSHPGSLIITSRLKMHSADERILKIDLWGQRQRRFSWKKDDKANLESFQITERLINKLKENANVTSGNYSENKPSVIYSNVNHNDIIEYIQDMKMIPDGVGDDALIKHIDYMKRNMPEAKFKVVLVALKEKTNMWFHERTDNPLYHHELCGKDIFLSQRTISINGNLMKSPKAELGSSNDESLLLDINEVKRINDECKKSDKKAYNRDYLRSPKRNFPALIIYPFNLIAVTPFTSNKKNTTKETSFTNISKSPHIGYVVSFPILGEENFGKSAKELRSINKATQHSFAINKQGQRELDLGFNSSYYDDNYDEDDDDE